MSSRRGAGGAQLNRGGLDGSLSLDYIALAMNFKIELEREDDGRWIAEVPDLPGVLTYGTSRDDAMAHVQALALRVLADRLEHGEAAPNLLSVTFKAA